MTALYSECAGRRILLLESKPKSPTSAPRGLARATLNQRLGRGMSARMRSPGAYWERSHKKMAAETNSRSALFDVRKGRPIQLQRGLRDKESRATYDLHADRDEYVSNSFESVPPSQET